MAFPDDLFPVSPIADDPTVSPWGWVPPEWTAPPAPSPGVLEAGGVPAAAVNAIAPGAAQLEAPNPSPAPVGAPPPYAITPYDGEAALPGDVTIEAPTGPEMPSTSLGASADGSDLSLPSMQPEVEPVDYAGNPLANPDQDAAIGDLVGMSGEGFTRIQAQQDAQRDEIVRTGLLQEATRNREALELNEKARLEGIRKADVMRAEVEAEAQDLANEKLDSGRWWSNGGTGRKVLGFLSAIVGGLVQGRVGGRNEGLAFIEREIDRDIEEQKFNLGQRKGEIQRRTGMVAELYARTGDMYRAGETARLAALGAAENELKAQALNYDPRGSTYLKIAGSIRDFQARRAELLGKMGVEQAKLEQDKEKSRLELEKFEEAKRKNRADEKIAAWGRANEGKRIKLDKTQGAARLGLDEKKLDVDIAKLEREGNKAEAKELRELGIGGMPTMAADGKISPTASLVQPDGSTFKAPTPEIAEDLRKKLVAARELNEILSEIMDIRDKVGGESDTWNSAEKQRLDVLKNKAVLVAKAGTQGMSSDADLKRIEEMLGVESVKSFRARADGLEEARKRINTLLDKEFRARDYKGEPIEIKTARDFKRPEDTAEETKWKATIGKPNVGVTEAGQQAMSIAHREANKLRAEGKLTNDADWNAHILKRKKELEANHKDISPNQIRDLADMADKVRSGAPEEQARAKAFLEDAAKNGSTKAIREAAKGELRGIVGGDLLRDLKAK